MTRSLYTDYSLISKLFPGSREDFLCALIETYVREKYAIVNYLYFASAMKYRLFEYQDNARFAAYKQALGDSSLFLTDGIALQVFAFFVRMIGSESKWWLENLNGTDLTPYILTELPRQGMVSVYLYNLYDPRIGKTSEWVEKTIEAFVVKFPEVKLAWHYSELYQKRGETISLDTIAAIPDESDFKIFLNCTGSPFQEIWAYEHLDFFRQHRFIVLNSGGVVDFISGFEKRAPTIFVKLRVFETLWRLLMNPKKNLPKFLSMFGIVRVLAKTLAGSILNSTTAIKRNVTRKK